MLFRPKYLGFDLEEPHFEHGNTALCGKETTTMGDFWSDLLNYNPLALVVTAMTSLLSNINVSASFNKSIQNIVQGISNVALQIDPLYFTIQFLKTDPLTANFFKQVNAFTGGLLTTTENLGTLPLLVASGQTVTKQQILLDAVLAIEIIGVVVSGGTAAAFIGAGAAQLSQGTLGKTPQGKLILGLIGLTAVGVAAYEQAGGLASELDQGSDVPDADAAELDADSTPPTSSEGGEATSPSQAAGEAVSQKGATQYATPIIAKKAGVSNPLTALLIGAGVGTVAVAASSGADTDDTTAAAQSSLNSAGGKAAVITATKSYGPYGGAVAGALISSLANGGSPSNISIPMSDGSTRTVVSTSFSPNGTTYTLDDGTQVTIPAGTIGAASLLSSITSSPIALPLMGIAGLAIILVTGE
jgi:hypothetical protein